MVNQVNDFKFHTEPFDHQRERFYLYRDKEFHAHLWEQRTGKSKIVIDTAAWLYGKGQINGLLIISPNGVHLGWCRNEIKIHMAPWCGCEPVVWKSSPNAEERKYLEKLKKNSSSLGLRCLSMNVEALNTPKGYDFALQFMRNYRTLFVIDEGSIIKNVEALRTQKIIGHRGKPGLNVHAPYKRLLNGTPVTNSPLDVYPQMVFLDDYILPSSYVAFKNRYAVVEMQGKFKWKVMQALEEIAGQWNRLPWGDMESSEEDGLITAGLQPLDEGPPIEFTVTRCGRTGFNVNWSCGKQNRKAGRKLIMTQPGDVYPVVKEYRYLDELQRKIAPHSDRVLKADCLDLPDKIYQKRYVELSKKQHQMYEELKKKSITECKGKEMSAGLAIVKMLRLQQIVGGFYVPDDIQITDQACLCEDWNTTEEVITTQHLDRKALPIDEKNHRIEALLDDLELTDGKALIWARFVAEIEAITVALKAKYGKLSTEALYGSIPSDKRQDAITRFQTSDEPRFLVANPACKGVSRGQNLNKATVEYYYSNSFSLEDRLQSEDRIHSAGVTINVGVIDIVAIGTLDEKIIDALRAKKNLADEVTGDRLISWI